MNNAIKGFIAFNRPISDEFSLRHAMVELAKKAAMSFLIVNLFNAFVVAVINVTVQGNTQSKATEKMNKACMPLYYGMFETSTYWAIELNQ